MDVRSATSLSNALPSTTSVHDKKSTGFEDILRGTISDTNRLQLNAEKSIEAQTTGEDVDPTAMVNAINQADLAFRTLIQIRNKLVQAYDELRQMQI